MWRSIFSSSTSGGTGYFAEYVGNVFEEMSMEGRMTVCNLLSKWVLVEAWLPDQKTFDFLEGRLYAQKETNGRKQKLLENLKKNG
jgi:3-isopropylmalate/(R)-2-methylmalate dehydratase large subunit